MARRWRILLSLSYCLVVPPSCRLIAPAGCRIISRCPLLLELTSLEPLTLEEELRMQEEWHCNERKCTFVILVRNLLLLNLNIGDGDRVPLPLPPKEKVKEEGNQRLHPLLIGWMLHAMIWDVNLLVSNVEEYGNNGNKGGPCLTRIILRSMQ